MTCDGPDCEKAIDQLYLFLDREIDTASCEEIQSHIDDCADCLNEFHLEEVVKMLVSRSCTEVAPRPLRDKVLYSIRQVEIQVQLRDDLGR